MMKNKLIFLTMAILWIVSILPISITEDVFASAIQLQPREKIFAASCATCHGATGMGGVTWVKNDPSDRRIAPQIAGLAPWYIAQRVRRGSDNGLMPAFGPEEITNAELDALALWLRANPQGVPALTAPTGTEKRLNILDADPWYSDGGSDDDNVTESDTAGIQGSEDVRRVVLGIGVGNGNQYLKVVNTGRTWHTFTNSAKGKDSGFIGYAGNYKYNLGDLGNMGYYYADPDLNNDGTVEANADLVSGCERYLCKMHPYMQVEVCVGTLFGVLTRASKNPIGLPAAGAAGSEVWVTTQSQEEAGEDTTTVANNSVAGLDGTYQVIYAADPDGVGPIVVWDKAYIANVGNNPHNAWPGKDIAGNDVVVTSSWHDNTVTLMNAATKTKSTLGSEKRVGATIAHVMVTPGSAERFYVTQMGGIVLQELDVNSLTLGLEPNVGGVIRGKTGPHGLWFCDDGVHVLTADTFGNSATLYNIQKKSSVFALSGGSAPLAPSIMGGYNVLTGEISGCRRGFTNNALTADVSIYEIYPVSGAESIKRLPQTAADSVAPGVDYNSSGNIMLRDTTISGGVAAGLGNPVTPTYSGLYALTPDPVRWVALPIQTPVSPAGSGHPRYMVTANKASHNVSVTALSSTTGLPTALYTFPAGLGAHGVTYGQKALCTGSSPCYYAYVTNTFEGGENSGGANAGYISVYDLENIATAGKPGSAFTILATSSGGVGAGVGTAITSLAFPTTIAPVIGSGGAFVCLDLTAGDGVLMDTDSEMVYVEGLGAGAVIANLVTAGPDLGVVKTGSAVCAPGEIEIDLGAVPNPNGIADVVEIAVLAALVSGADLGTVGAGCIVTPGGLGVGTADLVEGALLGCLTAGGNAGDTDGDGLGPDLLAPITALCPDCRSGVHVGDIPLVNAPGLPNNAPPLADEPTEYTYVKEDVWVDDVSPFVVCVPPPVGGVACGLAGQLLVGIGGTQNSSLLLDLDLQISTGGQGIVGRPAATPWP